MFVVYVIDPTTPAIYPRNYNPKTEGWDALRDLIGCECIEPLYLSNGDAIYVDESGRLDETKSRCVFTFHDDQRGETDYLFGKAVYIGLRESREDDNTEDDLVETCPSVSIQDVAERLSFYRQQTH